MGPVEGIELENVRWMLGERIATVIGVLKGVLPIMRPISERTNAEESIILTLGAFSLFSFSEFVLINVR